MCTAGDSELMTQTFSRLLLRISTCSFSRFSMSSGIFVSWLVPRFSSTMFVHVPISANRAPMQRAPLMNKRHQKQRTTTTDVERVEKCRTKASHAGRRYWLKTDHQMATLVISLAHNSSQNNREGGCHRQHSRWVVGGKRPKMRALEGRLADGGQQWST